MPPKKMVDLQVLETSGVDHPAHLHEGFAVMKSNNPDTAKAIMDALGKDSRPMTGQTGRPAPAAKAAAPFDAEAFAAALAPVLGTEVAKAMDTKLQPILDTFAQGWKDLRAYAETTDEDTPSTTTPGDPAAPAAAEVLAQEQLLKAAPAEFRDMLKAQQDQLKEAVAKAAEATELAKSERDARLDAEAIAVSKAAYTNLAVDHDTVAPALRKLELIAPDIAKALTAQLVSANAQLDGTSAITAELGTVSKMAAPGTAREQVEKAAQELVDDGQFDTIQKARAHVFTTRTDLTDAVRQEA